MSYVLYNTNAYSHYDPEDVEFIHFCLMRSKLYLFILNAQLAFLWLIHAANRFFAFQDIFLSLHINLLFWLEN